MISKRSNPGASKSFPLRPYLFDTIYLGGLAASLPYLFLSGKGSFVLDHWRRRFRRLPRRSGDRACLWVHGVSVGELLSVRRFLSRFTEQFRDWDVVLSSTTRAGTEAAQLHYPDTPIVPYPFDFSRSVRRVFDSVRPQLVAIVEHELWPNFLAEADRRRVPVALVNGRLSSRSLRGYQRLSRFVRWPPASINLFCVEDENTADGFRQLGVPSARLCVTGNMKFDSALSRAGRSGADPEARRRLGIQPGEWVFIASSTHAGEEEPVLRAFKAIHAIDPHVRLILAPRRVDRVPELTRACRDRDLPFTLWSRCSAFERPPGVVVIVDTVGELAGMLAVGNAVFVGGSLVPFGGHNIIEPAAAGRAVLTGPHYASFRSVVQSFQRQDAILVVRDGNELLAQLVRLRQDAGLAQRLGARAQATVERHTGASQRTLDALQPLIRSIGRTEIESDRSPRGRSQQLLAES